jgi:hypothetical protein
MAGAVAFLNGKPRLHSEPPPRMAAAIRPLSLLRKLTQIKIAILAIFI